jgi:conjugal transfer pilus assembly protein TraK
MIRSVSRLLLALALTANNASALQVLEGAEGELLVGKISQRELTRLTVDRERIKFLRFSEGDLLVEKDDDNGQMLIRPGDLSGKAINVFVSDEKGRTYGLLLQPVDMPSDSIVVRERGALRQSGGTRIEKAGSYERVIKNMVLAMASDAQPGGVEVREVSTDIPVWVDTRLTLQRLFLAASIVGEKYVLANIGKDPLTVVEQELYRKGVLAVSIENMNLAPGEATNVFVVRERKLNE